MYKTTTKVEWIKLSRLLSYNVARFTDIFWHLHEYLLSKPVSKVPSMEFPILQCSDSQGIKIK